MDRYFRYDRRYDGCIPKLYFACKIFNKDNKLIGARFIDVNQPVYIDIPVDNIFPQPGLSPEFISKNLEEMTNSPSNNPTILNFSFFRQSSITLGFRKDDAIPPIYLNDDFSFIGNPPENITSFYMPKCVLRYKNMDFANNGRNKLLLAMGIIHNKEFRHTFQPFHLEHLNFINRDVIVVRMRTRLANKFLINRFFENTVTDFCNENGYPRTEFDLTFDNSNQLLVLTIHQDTNFGPLTYCIPNITEEGCFNSGTKYRYGLNDERNRFFLIPDGGYNVFNHQLNLPKPSELSDGAKLFIEKCTKYNTSWTYYFDNGLQDKMHMYIGIAPNMGIPFFEGISDAIDRCIESPEMELLQHIMTGECRSCNIDFVCNNNKVLCKMTKEYDADIYFFGIDKSKEVYDKILAAYKGYFQGMDAEAEYTDIKLFAFSLSVDI